MTDLNLRWETIETTKKGEPSLEALYVGSWSLPVAEIRKHQVFWSRELFLPVGAMKIYASHSEIRKHVEAAVRRFIEKATETGEASEGQ